MIPSTRESSEDVIYTYTWHTNPWCGPDIFPRSQRVTSQTVEAPNPWCQTREIKSRGRRGSVYTNWKIPEGQLYVPKLKPTAPIRLADRNHAHYPPRHRTILKKKTARWRTSSTRNPIHMGDIGRCYTYSWRTSLQVYMYIFISPEEKGSQY